MSFDEAVELCARTIARSKQPFPGIPNVTIVPEHEWPGEQFSRLARWHAYTLLEEQKTWIERTNQ